MPLAIQATRGMNLSQGGQNALKVRISKESLVIDKTVFFLRVGDDTT